MYNEDILKEMIMSLINNLDDINSKYEIIQDIYEEITSELYESDSDIIC